MRADAALGIAVAVALLDLGAGQGVGVVAGPDLGEVAQNAEVEAVAAGGAALKENVRKAPGERVHHPVKPEDVAVGGLALPLRGQIGGIDVGEIAVVVPLDVADLRRGEHLRHLVDQEVLHGGVGEVQQALIAALAVVPAGDRHGPVRVRGVETAVDVHHLRLHPDAEVHAEGPDLAGQPVEAARQLLSVWLPVAEGAGVVAALAEPAVVHHEQLDPDVPPGSGQGDEAAFGDVEIAGLPTVEQHRPGLMLPSPPDDVLPHEKMQIAAQAGKALRRKAQHGFGRFKGFARR